MPEINREPNGDQCVKLAKIYGRTTNGGRLGGQVNVEKFVKVMCVHVSAFHNIRLCLCHISFDDKVLGLPTDHPDRSLAHPVNL